MENSEFFISFATAAASSGIMISWWPMRNSRALCQRSAVRRRWFAGDTA